MVLSLEIYISTSMSYYMYFSLFILIVFNYSILCILCMGYEPVIEIN